MLDKVKEFLRISHSAQDGLLNDLIASARADLIRLGISETKANSDEDALITGAIIVYCAKEYTKDSKEHERYTLSWQVRVDELRKSKNYYEES